ncbi:hypothetical protein Poli38472_001785 [Pythium oligandrum]|uniref:Uncharacterized protein n=1 Tax=Pythium oligandrum TaxID=41045 RepID=A0A8K1FQP2_PYTOL|nr:hypothetical protein Poli38472_001785 [Pythium oligandrum]|eukprot:TMW69629.1 hypothetical protein Poli38472_001785 [Pythium oligandrum]
MAEETQANGSTAASVRNGETSLKEMNTAFAKCLSLVCPPIQYPPHCRFNPVQQDSADMAEIEARLEEFFLHAKEIELLFLNDAATDGEREEGEGNESPAELELEILHLENELSEKNDLIEKYGDVIRGWEGKFRRLDNRMAPERE